MGESERRAERALPDLLRRHSANDARLRHEGAGRQARRRALGAIDAHVLRRLAAKSLQARQERRKGMVAIRGYRRWRRRRSYCGTKSCGHWNCCLKTVPLTISPGGRGRGLGGSPACPNRKAQAERNATLRALTLRSTSSSHACFPPKPAAPGRQNRGLEGKHNSHFSSIATRSREGAMSTAGCSVAASLGNRRGNCSSSRTSRQGLQKITQLSPRS